MHRMLKQIPILGLAAGLAALAPRVAAAQETTTRDSTVQAAPGDTGEMENPPGYRGMERPASPTDSALVDTTADDSLRQDDSTGAVAPARRDSASVLPGDSASIKPKSPSDRIAPADSPGTQGP
ncbi:MAG TPA: hypothetical protein VFT84_08480 [Gemmatimonadales bacterium]|nr:hypothetical protein [Gemmatimonadales bacterium]